MELPSRNLFLYLWTLLSFIQPVPAEVIHDNPNDDEFTRTQLQHKEMPTMPSFVEPVKNVTIAVGREATVTCAVSNLNSFKVAWVRVDTQTILTIHTHVITRSHRIGLSHTDMWTWNLHIKNVRETDRGFYMCQINTDPMMSQVGFLQVVVPPDILDYPTSTDMVVRENTNVTLHCAVTGFPKPTVVWRREDKLKITHGDVAVESVEGAVFNLSKVNRLHMGAYLCIASNGVPPSVSRRITLIVHFPPMISIPNQLVGASEGQDVVLECHSEAYPKSINYWSRDTGETIVSEEKYEAVLLDNAYKVTMRLTIREVSQADFGTYVCLSKNSLGETDGTIKLYPLIPSTLAAKTTTLPSSSSVGNGDKGGGGGGGFGVGGTKRKTHDTISNGNYSRNQRRNYPQRETFIPRTSNEMIASEPKESSDAAAIKIVFIPLLILNIATSFLIVSTQN